MSASKNVFQLEYEQCLEVLQQFEEKHPDVKTRSDYLGITIANIDSGSVLKITVTQAGEAEFVKATKLPKEFEVCIDLKKSFIKVIIHPAPILTNVAPKSSNRRPANPIPVTAPVIIAPALEAEVE